MKSENGHKKHLHESVTQITAQVASRFPRGHHNPISVSTVHFAMDGLK